MTRDNIHRLQDTFLEHLQKKQTPVTVFLGNGVKLQGVVVSFDAFCILLEREGQQQIVYKHSITTTSPAQDMDLQEEAPQASPVRVERRPTVVIERRPRPHLTR
jgi:host factor-I protein